MTDPERWEPLERETRTYSEGRTAFRAGLRGEVLTEPERYLALSYANSRTKEDMFEDVYLSSGLNGDLAARYLKDRTLLGRLVDRILRRG